MRYVTFLLLFMCFSFTSVAQQSRAADLLQAEPEAHQLTNTARAPIGNWYTVIANESLRRDSMRDIMMRLNHRLYDDLLACEGRCKEQDAREAEFWLLQSHLAANGLTPFPDRQNKPADHRWQSEVRSRDSGIYSDVVEYCQKFSGVRDIPETTTRVNGRLRVGSDPAAEAAAKQKETACVLELFPLGKAHSTSDASVSPYWDSHIQVWKGCLPKYQFKKGVFEQQPYDQCMNRYDLETTLLTRRRALEGKRGEALGPIPTEEDVSYLKNLSTTFQP